MTHTEDSTFMYADPDLVLEHYRGKHTHTILYTYICIYIHIYTNIYTNICTYILTYTLTYTLTHTNILTYTYTTHIHPL
jgi:hypothetical protein